VLRDDDASGAFSGQVDTGWPEENAKNKGIERSI
jgi:hypothetical protein